MPDRIAWVRIQNLRPIQDLTLPLGGLQVLIGENGSGKSSLVEAFEVLRKAALSQSFIHDSLRSHGGLENLLRAGESELTLSLRVESEGPPIDYSFSVAREGSATLISKERLDIHQRPAGEPFHLIQRDRARSMFFDSSEKKLVKRDPGPTNLLLASFGSFPPPGVRRVLEVLQAIEVHVPFDVRPLWTWRDPSSRARLRLASSLAPAERVERFGENLLSCYHHLKNQDTQRWQRVLERIRAGLGHDISDLVMPMVNHGEAELQLKLAGQEKAIPASALSDGQLSFLGFVALAEMNLQQGSLVFDEPELHLHPGLLREVVGLLEQTARHRPVLVTTHSDLLLNALSQPEQSVILCEQDEHRAMRLLHPDREQLQDWLADYDGIGTLRAQGYLRHAMRERPVNPPTEGTRTEEVSS